MNRLPGSVPLTIRIQLECNFECELAERQVKVIVSSSLSCVWAACYY